MLNQDFKEFAELLNSNSVEYLIGGGYALAAYEPPQATAALSEPLRQAYASAAPADIELPKEVATASPTSPRPRCCSCGSACSRASSRCY